MFDPNLLETFGSMKDEITEGSSEITVSPRSLQGDGLFSPSSE